MSRERGTAAVVASPVLVGAVTILVTVVAVFLAYNANEGLPFVPTYDLTAEIPNGSNLVPGNEVRIGGFRVGVVDTMRPKSIVVDGRTLEVVLIDMRLDKQVQPLAKDSTLIVRARSALGLKYVELTPGTSPATYKPGETIPLKYASLPVEFDDFLNTFDEPTRLNSQADLGGFGDALAGRGADLNTAIAGFVPFFQFLQPVMANLSDPKTQLGNFFTQLGRTTAQVEPVAAVQTQLFGNMASTFEAINSTEGQCGNSPAGSCLQGTIAKSPPTQDTAIQSFQVQRPFLADFTDLSRRLIPAAQVIPTAVPKLNEALLVGTPVQLQSITLSNNTTSVFNSLNTLAKDPNTFLALRDLRDTFGVSQPLVNYVAPFQTVCNYANYFFNGLGNHIGEPVSNGTIERILLKTDNSTQANAFSNTFAYRPNDVPANESVHTAKDPLTGQSLESQHGVAYPPAIDAQGNANCQQGQSGFIEGPLTGLPAGVKPRYGPAAVSDPSSESQLESFEQNQAGGSHGQRGNYPLLEGTTYTGVPRLRDVH